MTEFPLVVLASIGIVSLICQWVAWRLRLPAILFLLVAGIVMGPGIGFLDPDTLFGDLLFPIVSLAVAVILFEGSLTLKFSEMQEHGKMVRNLLFVGMSVTWMVGTIVSHYVVNMSWPVAALFGAIVVVSGPTVIMPLLRAVRPNGRISNILKWEGIVIDPMGALLAVLVFEFVISTAGEDSNAIGQTLSTFGSTLALGTALGCGAGYALGQGLRNHWLPQFLQNAGTLMFMLGVFSVSNFLVHESGLLTITIMGIWLANMKGVPVDDILEFKESLSVLLISGLFILLAARIDFGALISMGWGAIWVILTLMFIARPLSVWLSAIGTDLSPQEKTFLSWIAPRGIVAAAVSALFAFKLEEAGVAGAEAIVPLVFLVIITTVIFQSLTSSIVAKAMNVQQAQSNGFIFIGANKVARALAKAFISRGVRVVLTDTGWDNVRAARMENLPVYFGNAVSEHAENNLDLTGIGNMLAISPYRQLNTLATYHYLDLFERKKVFGLPENEQDGRARQQSAEKYVDTRKQFDESLTYAKLASTVAQGANVKITTLTSEFSYDDYLDKQGRKAMQIFTISPNKEVFPLGQNSQVKPKEGWDVLSFLPKLPPQNNKEADAEEKKNST